MDKELSDKSINTDASTARKLAGEHAYDALMELATALDNDGKAYGAQQIRHMAGEAYRWANCI